MDKQKFNLAKELTLSKLMFLSAASCMKMVAVVIALLISVQMLLLLQQTRKNDHLAELQHEQVELVQSINRIKNEKKQWLEHGTIGFGHKIGSAQGFSAILNDLARLDLKNLWLTDIIVSNKDGEITLGGSSILLSDLNYWLSELAVSPSMAGKNFDFIEITKDPLSRNLVFRTSTVPLSNKNRD